MNTELLITDRMEKPATQVFSIDGKDILGLGMTDHTRGWMNIVNLYPALGVAYQEYGAPGIVGTINALMETVESSGITERNKAFDLCGLEPDKQLEKLATMHNFTSVVDMIRLFGCEEPAP